MEVKEFEIPVPWGHIAVKAYGAEENTPVFMVHGVSDNAGIFDRVMPLLPTSYYYICIDLPSHGKSSLYPPYLLITPFDILITYKLVLDYLNRKKYICIGHSWGGQTLSVFTQMYPRYVLKLILIDAFYLFPLDVKYFRNYWTFRIDNLMKITDRAMNNAPFAYTYKEAIERVIKNRRVGTLTKESAENLLQRSLIPVGDEKFRFTTDQRVKVYTLSGFDLKFMIGLAKQYPINCPILMIIASQTNASSEEFIPLTEEMQRRFPKCKIEIVDGNHNDLSDYPDKWATSISNFLTTVNNKL